MRAGFHQLLCQRPVVRHQQQSLACIIQPPYRIHALPALREQIHHRRPPLRVAHRRHIPLWLVQQVIDEPLRLLERLPINANLVPFRIGLGPLVFVRSLVFSSRSSLLSYLPLRMFILSSRKLLSLLSLFTTLCVFVFGSVLLHFILAPLPRYSPAFFRSPPCFRCAL